LASETGPWASDTIAYTYTNRLRTRLDLQQPNASDWLQSYGYDMAARMTGITSPAGSFTNGYNAGLGGTVSSSSLVQELALPSVQVSVLTIDTNSQKVCRCHPLGQVSTDKNAAVLNF
jgi:hypothetical protein